MTWLVDAHIHLSDVEYSSDIKYIINAMERLRIKACCVSMDVQSSKSTLHLGVQSPLILPFVGIHPEKANDDLDFMSKLIIENQDKIAGIGEIGLDKTYVTSQEGFERQILVFNKMLSLAEKLRKPVSIHSRKTLDDILAFLPSYSIHGILLHWFSGSKKQLQKSMDLGCYVSYGPAMLYSKDKQVLLSETNLDKILIETDGPVRFARCFGFKSAQITFLPSVLFCASCILDKSYDETLSIIYENSNAYLGV